MKIKQIIESKLENIKYGCDMIKKMILYTVVQYQLMRVNLIIIATIFIVVAHVGQVFKK